MIISLFFANQRCIYWKQIKDAFIVSKSKMHLLEANQGCIYCKQIKDAFIGSKSKMHLLEANQCIAK
jgi:hypothetical protein